MSSKPDFYCGSCNRRKAMDQLARTKAGVNSCRDCATRSDAAKQRLKKQGYTG